MYLRMLSLLLALVTTGVFSSEIEYDDTSINENPHRVGTNRTYKPGLLPPCDSLERVPPQYPQWIAALGSPDEKVRDEAFRSLWDESWKRAKRTWQPRSDFSNALACTYVSQAGLSPSQRALLKKLLDGKVHQPSFTWDEFEEILARGLPKYLESDFRAQRVARWWSKLQPAQRGAVEKEAARFVTLRKQMDEIVSAGNSKNLAELEKLAKEGNEALDELEKQLRRTEFPRHSGVFFGFQRDHKTMFAGTSVSLPRGVRSDFRIIPGGLSTSPGEVSFNGSIGTGLDRFYLPNGNPEYSDRWHRWYDRTAGKVLRTSTEWHLSFATGKVGLAPDEARLMAREYLIWMGVRPR